MDWLAIITLPGVQISVAGGFGGIARWLFVIIMDRKMATSQGLATIFLGGILGFFISPHMGDVVKAIPFLSGVATDSDRLPTFNAFFIGIVGVSVIGFAIDWAARLKKPSGSQPVSPTPTPIDGGT